MSVGSANVSIASLNAMSERLQNSEPDTEEEYDPNALDAGPPPRLRPRSALPGTPPPRPLDPAPQAPVPPPTAVSKAGDRVHTSVYLPRDLRRRLREIAAAEECKVHDLILEGVRDLVRRRQGSCR